MTQNLLAKVQLSHLAIGSILLRFIASFTNFRAAQPDEWFATLEYSNLFVGGLITNAIDFHCHLRNLTWPSLLTVPKFFFEELLGFSPYYTIALTKFLVSLIDLIILATIVKFSRRMQASKSFLLSVSAAVLFPWFMIEEAVRPAIEHASALALWGALFLLAQTSHVRKSHFFAGLFCVLTGVFRYPSGLLGVGVVVCVVGKYILDQQFRRDFNVGLFLAGIAVGLVVGGLPDFLAYGRPWESLWMYLQFNVFTGLSSEIYGAQSSQVYIDYLIKRFFLELAPFGILGIILVPLGFISGLKSLQPWAFALLFFVLGHLVPQHKEGRFLAPILHLIIWAGFYGYLQWREKFIAILQKNLFKKFAYTLISLSILANSVKLLETLRGEFGKPRLNFFKAEQIAGENNACALITSARPVSSWLRTSQGKLLGPPVGIRVGREIDSKVFWLDHLPNCSTDGHLVLQVDRLNDPLTKALGCRLWDEETELHPIYQCPASSLNYIQNYSEFKGFSRQISALPELPPLGTTGEMLLKSCLSEQEKNMMKDSPYSGG